MSDYMRYTLIMLCIWTIFCMDFLGVVFAGDNTEKEVQITRLPPDPRGGQAYRLTYHVPLPLDIFWKFKTDFDNKFLVTNKYILRHRLISRDGDIVITEDVYSSTPSERFQWQTKIVASHHRLEFELLDTKAHNHRFHYGVIQLQALGETTRVTQTAFFDFLGASLWAAYPWGGGMKAFLNYTADWERETAMRMAHHYTTPRQKKDAPPYRSNDDVNKDTDLRP